MYVKEGLLIHKKQRHLFGTFRCAECDFEGKFPAEITGHVSDKHPSNLHAECPACNESIAFGVTAASKEFETHYKVRDCERIMDSSWHSTVGRGGKS